MFKTVLTFAYKARYCFECVDVVERVVLNAFFIQAVTQNYIPHCTYKLKCSLFNINNIIIVEKFSSRSINSLIHSTLPLKVLLRLTRLNLKSAISLNILNSYTIIFIRIKIALIFYLFAKTTLKR